MIKVLPSITSWILVLAAISTTAAQITLRQDNTERELQSLKEFWDIQEPEFTFYEGEFIFRWRTSDYIQDRLASVRLYDGWDCKEGSNDITDVATSFFDGTLWLQNLGLQPDANTPYQSDPELSGQGVRDFRLFLDVQPNVADAPFFQYIDGTDGLQAKMKFCLRFGLFNGDIDIEETLEVNFQETLVEYTVDLTDGFSISSFNAAPKDRIERTANVACEIIGYECDSNNQPISDPGYLRNQGSETRVCARLSEESKREGLYLDRIYWFYFIREDDGGDVRQNAIIFDSVEAPNLLTEYNCMRGVEVCGWNTVLRADFYQWAGVGIVRGIGEGLCQFGQGIWLVEDVERPIGEFLGWVHHEPARDGVQSWIARGFPVGSTVSYNDLDGNRINEIVEDSDTFEISVATENNETQLLNVLDTLTLKAPLHSDENFQITVTVVTVGGYEHLYNETVTVYAVADPPQVSAVAGITLQEDGTPLALQINPDRSPDEDNSEYLSVIVSVPRDENGYVGSFVETASSDGILLTQINEASVRIETTTTGDSPADREAILEAYLASNLVFKPRDNWSGVRTGEDGIRVTAVSTEQADFEIATPNSVIHGTLGDMDCRIEVATTFVDIEVEPVNDIPYQLNSATTVQENKLNSDVDVDVVIAIGERIGLQCDDMDGSQTLDATISGFPSNLIDLSVPVEYPNVNLTIDRVGGTVQAAGQNVVEVLDVLNSIVITLADDDDSNFLLEIQGTSTDSNGLVTVSEEFYLTHQVIVQAVVDTPSLELGESLKGRASETDTFVAYPVTIGLNDEDGSETFLGDSVVVSFSTSTEIAVGAEPEFNFPVSTGLQITTSTGKVTLTGTTSDIEAAMASMEIKPGAHNGEDIYVEVNVTAAESNPTETGSGEVAKFLTTVVDSFIIPVDPVIQGEPNITIPSVAGEGYEDTVIPLGTIEVSLDGTQDPDGSETLYIECDMSTFPEMTYFWVDGVKQLGTQIDSQWLRLPGSIVGFQSFLEVQPPPNFSGIINLMVRAIAVDRSATGSVDKVTDAQAIPISVFPVADDIKRPKTVTVGREDQGPYNVGARVINTGMRPVDDSSGTGNNPESETIFKVEVVVPFDEEDLTYQFDSSSVLNSAEVSEGTSDEGRLYSFTSSLIPDDTESLVGVSQDDRLSAQLDIQNLLKTMTIDIGPEHNSRDGTIKFIVSTADVNLEQVSTKTVSFNHKIRIQAIADAPNVFTYSETTAIAEDTGVIPLHIEVSKSADTDESESLSVRILCQGIQTLQWEVSWGIH